MLIILFDDTKFIAATAKAFCGVNSPPIRYLFAGQSAVDQANLLGLSYGIELFDLRNVDTLVGTAPDKVAVFIQGLSTPNAAAFELLKSRICAPVVIWRCFGAEFYYNFHHRSLYEPLTSGLLRYGFDLKTRLKAIPGVEEANRRLRAGPIRRIIERDVTHIAPVLPYEYYLIRETLGTAASYLRFSGGLSYDPVPHHGGNYLLGNSADPSNNHLDALETMGKRVRLAVNQKIIAPLSYGNRAYARVVTRRGRELFGDAFEPLIEFMPAEQYRTILASCSHVILNHRRQQALGNLIVALWNGASVYMNTRNLAYAHFRDFLQVDLFPLEAIGTSPKANTMNNRAVLEAEYGSEQSRRNTEHLLRLVPR